MVLDVMEAGRGYKETWQMGQMGFMAVGMIASAAAGVMTPVEGMLSTELAMKIVAVIYAIFGAQMFLVPGFFMAENFKGWPEQGQAKLFLFFFMRMFGLLILTFATTVWLLAGEATLFTIFAIFNAIQIWQGPGKAITMFDCTEKHIVPVILLPLCGFIAAATLL